MAATIPRRQQVLTFLNTKLFFNFCKADINKAGFVECSDDDANTFNFCSDTLQLLSPLRRGFYFSRISVNARITRPAMTLSQSPE